MAVCIRSWRRLAGRRRSRFPFVTVEKPPSSASAPPRLWQRLWRRPAFKRSFYELLGLLLFRHRGLQMLNCGHHQVGGLRFILTPEQEAERPGFALYHRLASGVVVAGTDVLEIGCGRAAGARFIAERFAPRSYLATDASRMLIAAARRHAAPPHLRLLRAPAEKLALPDASFDLCLAVEAMTLIADKPAFLATISRLLRPAGAFFVADYFYTRPTSPNAAGGFRNAVEHSPLRIEAEEDWTANAVAALEIVSPERLAMIERLPSLLRRPALAFAGTTESPLYLQLRDGRASYLHFRLRRR
jgi:SAM-dependent methyltransferase